VPITDSILGDAFSKERIPLENESGGHDLPTKLFKTGWRDGQQGFMEAVLCLPPKEETMSLATVNAEVPELVSHRKREGFSEINSIGWDSKKEGLIVFWLDLLFPLDPFYPIP